MQINLSNVNNHRLHLLVFRDFLRKSIKYLLFHLLTQKILINLRNTVISFPSMPDLLAQLLLSKFSANFGKQINNCKFLRVLMLVQDLFDFFIFFSKIKNQSLFFFYFLMSKFTQNPRLNLRFSPRHFGIETR